MRRRVERIATLVCASLVLTVHCNTVFAVPLLSVTPPTTTPSVGDMFSISVDVTDITDLYAWQFDLLFTPGLWNADQVTEGPFLASNDFTFFVQGYADDAGIYGNANTVLGPVAGASGVGTLASFSFLAQSAGIGNFSLGNVLLLDSSLNVIDAINVPLELTILSSGPVAVAEPGSSSLLCVWLLGLTLSRLMRFKPWKLCLSSGSQL